MKKTIFSRRGFLAGTLAATVGPMIVPARVLGRAGSTAPSERIAMGFIGQGGQGSGHLFGGSWTYVAGGYLGRGEVQVLGVCDVWRPKRESAKERVNQHYAQLAGTGSYTSCEAYRDFRELLAREDVDAVLMALPFHLHAPMATMAMKYGKDVYSEKPIAMTIEEGRILAETMKRYGRVYQAGTQQRSEYDGKFRRAIELVRNGYIGQLKEIYSFSPGGGFNANMQNVYDPGIPIPEDLDWDLYVGPGPWQPYTGGNANCGLFSFGDPNWGPHHYDVVNWALEKDCLGPIELSYENDHAVLRYENGVVVHACRHPSEGVGGVGGVCCVGTEGYVAVDRENIVSNPAGILNVQLKPADRRVYESKSHAGNFLDCIRTRKRTICSAETAHRSMSLVLLAGIVTQLKRKMAWDPVKEIFPEDEQANRMLSYARRPGWEV
ncbi:MAG: Gfo/Idh/MocA family oxidoreductase [Candidatus Hydrogenedentes bacterium]|nr:Gfo/Idh/MocA family oxidoreductase [Candidatus Hydrogenedentota bacterium]